MNYLHIVSYHICELPDNWGTRLSKIVLWKCTIRVRHIFTAAWKYAVLVRTLSHVMKSLAIGHRLERVFWDFFLHALIKCNVLLLVKLKDFSLNLFIYLFAKTMLYSIKLRQNINMHGLLETAGHINTSYADPWWTESTLPVSYTHLTLPTILRV